MYTKYNIRTARYKEMPIKLYGFKMTVVLKLLLTHQENIIFYLYVIKV